MSKRHPSQPKARTVHRKVAVTAIRADSQAQPRVALFPDRVAEYVEDMGRGDEFPPLVVFQDDKANCYWLADGFHRYQAAIELPLEKITCEVRKGELRDAILYSCSANAAHGMRRTNDDKRQAVSKLLLDERWGKWSDREIARRCHVSEHTVAKLRESLNPVTAQTRSEGRTYRTKYGTTAKMKTGRVGKSKPKSDESQVAPTRNENDIDVEQSIVNAPSDEQINQEELTSLAPPGPATQDSQPAESAEPPQADRQDHPESVVPGIGEAPAAQVIDASAVIVALGTLVGCLNQKGFNNDLLVEIVPAESHSFDALDLAELSKALHDLCALWKQHKKRTAGAPTG
jgi:hypothetical protein